MPEIILLFPRFLVPCIISPIKILSLIIFPFRLSAVVLLTTPSPTLIQSRSKNRSSSGLRQILTLDLSSSCKFVCFWFLLIRDLATNTACVHIRLTSTLLLKFLTVGRSNCQLIYLFYFYFRTTVAATRLQWWRNIESPVLTAMTASKICISLSLTQI